MAPMPDRSLENKAVPMLLVELALMLVCSGLVFLFAARHDLMERIWMLSSRYEAWQLDEIMVVALLLVIALTVFSIRRWVAFRTLNDTLYRRNEELQQVLIQIKELKGLLPICSVCKKIRDDEDSWHQLEAYIESHTHAEFTHGICPDCTKMLYPEYDAYKKAR